MGGTAITVPVSQLQDPVFVNDSPASASGPARAISVPVSQLSEPAQAPPSAQTTQPPSFWQKLETGLEESMPGQLLKMAGTPPQDSNEAAAYAAGQAGLVAYRAAKGIVQLHDNMMKAKGNAFWNAVDNFRQAALDYVLGNQRSAAMSAVAGGLNTVGATDAALTPSTSEAADIAQGAADGGNLVTPLTRGITDVGTAALGLKAPGAVGSLTRTAEEAPEAVAPEAEAATAAAPTVEKPNIIQKVLKGEKVAQGPAQSALRQAAGAGSDVQGIRTFLDKPIADLTQAERAAYDTVNKAAGTDLKALYDRSEELQDALDDPTQISNHSAQQKELAQTQAQIEEGERNALARGVSPDTLDKAIALTRTRYAGEEVARKIFSNESVVKGNLQFDADETVNVDAAIRNAENLNKPSKFAPRGAPSRLQQWFGKDGADNLLRNLYSAKKAGESAVSARKLLKMAGIGTAIGGPAALELVHRL